MGAAGHRLILAPLALRRLETSEKESVVLSITFLTLSHHIYTVDLNVR